MYVCVCMYVNIDSLTIVCVKETHLENFMCCGSYVGFYSRIVSFFISALFSCFLVCARKGRQKKLVLRRSISIHYRIFVTFWVVEINATLFLIYAGLIGLSNGCFLITDFIPQIINRYHRLQLTLSIKALREIKYCGRDMMRRDTPWRDVTRWLGMKRQIQRDRHTMRAVIKREIGVARRTRLIVYSYFFRFSSDIRIWLVSIFVCLKQAHKYLRSRNYFTVFVW